LKKDATCYKTALGYQVASNVEDYKGISIRNRVIMKLDVISVMTEMFTCDSLSEYRNIIFNIMSGTILDDGKISNLITCLYIADSVFKKHLTELLYFETDLQSKCPYIAIVSSFRKEYLREVGRLKSITGAQGCKFVIESEGYLYVAVPDRLFELVLPVHVKEEIVSYGKIWSGEIRRQG